MEHGELIINFNDSYLSLNSFEKEAVEDSNKEMQELGNGGGDE